MARTLDKSEDANNRNNSDYWLHNLSTFLSLRMAVSIVLIKEIFHFKSRYKSPAGV